MALEEAKAEFPVAMYKGEHLITVGYVEIHPTLDYKQFRVALNKIIGISYNNLTTYLIDNNRDHAIQPEEQQRKILITGKVDFSCLAREKKTCYYFLVVLKRSRRDRRQRKSRKQIRFDDHLVEQELDIDDNVGFGEMWLRELQMRRANYVNSVRVVNWSYGFDWLMDSSYPEMIDQLCPRVRRCRNNRDLCMDCMNADKQGEEPEFHLCVYDEVVEGFFLSPAGPICRPQKRAC